jgi:ferritin-like metal-binding protein YciE
MKSKLTNLTELFLDQLKSLYDAEKQLKGFLTWCIANASHKSLKIMLKRYAEAQLYQINGLEAIFEHFSCKPSARKNEVVVAFIHETKMLFQGASTTEVCDALIINYVEYIVQHKIAAYGVASSLARELRAFDVSEMLIDLQEIEQSADGALERLAIEHITAPEVVY